MTRPKLTYFKAAEFGIWWPMISADLLKRLDAFRAGWGAPVIISPVEGAIGRHGGGESQHNIDRWGEVRAVDVMPVGMDTAQDKLRAVQLAESVGFTGIGLYPDWKPRPGLHLDVREPKHPGYIARWAGIQTPDGQQYVGIEGGFA